MNGQFSRIFLFLSLAMIVVCLPAQAAHTDQSVSSSSMSNPGAQSNAYSDLSDTNSPGYHESVPGTDTGRSVSSPLLVQAGPEVMAPGKAQEGPVTADRSTQAGTPNTKTGSSPLTGPSADLSGRPDTSNDARADAVKTMGPSQGTGGENAAGTPDERGQSREPGRLAGMTIAPGGAAIAGSASGSQNHYVPVPGASGGPAPARQQHGPPAQSGSYPCGPAQASPLPPPAPGQTRDESKDESPSPQRSKRTGFWSRIRETIVPDPESPFIPVPPLSFLNMLVFGGFRRISKKNVLEHDGRQGIYQAITATPGVDLKTLASMTGINENTLRYHLDRLTATGKICCFTRPGVIRYFRNQGAYSQHEHEIFHYLRTHTPRGILWLLYQHPGLTRQHIADALRISGPSVTRQMDNLIDDGIVENRFPGRSNHYYLTSEAARTIEKVMSQVQVMIHSRAEVRAGSAAAV